MVVLGAEPSVPSKLCNTTCSSRNEGDAPVPVVDYNQGRVVDVDGVVDQNLAQCIADMLDDEKYPRLPFAKDPEKENQKITTKLDTLKSTKIPIPFLKAIFKQESNLKHFYVPRGADEDNYIVVGMTPTQGKNISSLRAVIGWDNSPCFITRRKKVKSKTSWLVYEET